MTRRLVIIGLILLGLLIAAMIAATIVAAKRGSALDAEIEKWEPLGGVPTLEELKPEPVSDEENAAVLYTDAFAIVSKLARFQKGELKWEFADEICDAEELDEIVNLAWRAAQRPECVWESDFYEKGFAAHFQHLTQARGLVLVLAKIAECKIERSDVDGAVRAIASGLALGTHVPSSEPCIMTALIAASTHYVMLESLQKTFRENNVHSTTEIKQSLLAIDYDAMLGRSLLGETAVGFGAMHEFDFGGMRPIASMLGWSVDADMAYYLSTMRGTIEQFDLPRQERDWSVLTANPPARARLSTMLLPSIDRAVISTFRTDVQVTFAREAINLREYRTVHGEYPETWPMPSDSLTGEPLRYERDNGGFVLWREEDAVEGIERIEWRWR